MTENELRQKVVDEARFWLGCNESDGSHETIIDIYNSCSPLPRGYKMSYKDPWCATFVSSVGIYLALNSIIFSECGCGPMVKLYQNAGRWVENDDYIPSPGDIIFYDWDDGSNYAVTDDTGEPEHVGIVESCDGSIITVIEGNISDSVGERRLEVNGRYIRGFGIPDYASEAPYADAWIVDAPVSASSDAVVDLPVLNEGDYRNAAVETMQDILIHRWNISCGADGSDGDFGPNTKKALIKFQETHGLDPTGTCDYVTWVRLILG